MSPFERFLVSLTVSVAVMVILWGIAIVLAKYRGGKE